MSILRQTAINASWLVSDRVLRLALNFIIGIFIARQLGPEGFGLLSYGQALLMLLTPIATAGMPDIVVREFSSGKRDADTVLTTAFLTRAALGFFALLLLVSTALIARDGNWAVTVIAFGYGLSFLPQSFDVFESRFQSLDRLGVLSSLRMGNAFLFTAARAVALLVDAPVETYAYLYSAEIAGFAVLSVLAARRLDIYVRPGRFDPGEAKFLLKTSWPLMLRLLAIAVYMRIDQLMVQHFLGDGEMGVYSAAVRLTELWYFVPMAIVAGAAPSLTRQYELDQKAYARELQRLMRLMILLAIVPAIVFTIGAPFIINLLYGPSYAAAAPVLAIQCWAGIFVVIGVTASPWFINTGQLRFGVYQALAGAVSSAALNVILIPRFGITGAAISVVISYGISAVLMNGLFRATRELFFMQIKALVLR